MIAYKDLLHREDIEILEIMKYEGYYKNDQHNNILFTTNFNQNQARIGAFRITALRLVKYIKFKPPLHEIPSTLSTELITIMSN